MLEAKPKDSLAAEVVQLETMPNLLGMHRANPERYPFLLESAAHGPEQGRYSLLFAFPGREIDLKAGDPPRDFLKQLDEEWQSERLAEADRSLPFSGGWFFYLSYEMAGLIEPSLRLPHDPAQEIAWAVRIPAAVIIDHHENCTWLVSEQPDEGRIKHLAQDAERSHDRDGSDQHLLLEEALTEEAPEHYCHAVDRTRRYIRDGDVFQANLSRSWQGRLRSGIEPADVYQRLRASNPGPFAGLAVRGDQAVISSSPERLVSRTQGWVNTRPIAGTRPRGSVQSQDKAMLDELIGHPKERAEHIMLIDLERNDLGRICQPGSVEVDELMVLESYAHVHHIVSNVRGQVDAGITPGQILAAVFPGGTITGCPKVRCMEIIAELEARPRGAYTGSLGYINRDGSMDSNILIRTMETRGRALRLLAGAGIVADSIPEQELDETRAKARGMLLALEH
ncbi:anthranilate synthase component 1 [Natronospira proteinivora]|uniref:Anthranilate synthase component 1 n=1 Tax=Natronospira proteinivora TaxID=1807133 RepID=A0ABT1G6E5_9GAMM|nr:aminodeoxychorismate synthase component I [Natronospira proteinivora]MCP1726866.1 anthranilate synthase component 1 [Natronospira proteinivora]